MVLEEGLHAEVALEVALVERVEVRVEGVRVPRLREREVFVVSKLAKVFADNVLKVIEHGCDRLNLIRVDLAGFQGLLLKRELGFFAAIFLLAYLVLFGNEVQLLFEFLLESVLKQADRVSEFLDGGLLSLNAFCIFGKLLFQKERVL